MEKREFTLTEEQTGRIDKVCAEVSGLTRSHIQKLIEEGYVLVNEEEPTKHQKVGGGDEIELTIPDPKLLDAKPEKMDLDILYEDDDILVLNKPKGLVCHPAVGNEEHTLVNGLLYHCQNLSGINGVIRPGIVHRIDKDTTGCLVVCKNDKAHEAIATQIQNKTCHREYIALVHGVIEPNEGEIIAPIGRAHGDRQKMAVTENGKPSTTEFTVLERFADYTLIKCRLKTGRTHQIRVHMQYIHHPVVGDPKYSLKNTRKDTQGQMLHACTLTLVHPTTQKTMVFEAPLPEYFETILKECRGGKGNE